MTARGSQGRSAWVQAAILTAAIPTNASEKAQLTLTLTLTITLTLILTLIHCITHLEMEE